MCEECEDDLWCSECDTEPCVCSEDFDDPDTLGLEFADPGGVSALRAAGPNNPRDRPCPTCGEPNRLTPKDVSLGYQCDACADKQECGGF